MNFSELLVGWVLVYYDNFPLEIAETASRILHGPSGTEAVTGPEVC